MIDLDKIEAVAKAAQEDCPPPWRHDETGGFELVLDSSPEPSDFDGDCWDGNLVADTLAHKRAAQYLTTCSPDVVLEMVARIRELERRVHPRDCMGCTRCT